MQADTCFNGVPGDLHHSCIGAETQQEVFRTVLQAARTVRNLER